MHSSSFPHMNWYYSLVTILFLLLPLLFLLFFPLFSLHPSFLPRLSFHFGSYASAIGEEKTSSDFRVRFRGSFLLFFVSTLLDTVITENEQYSWKAVLSPKKTEEKKHRRNEICKILLSCSTFFFFFFNFNFYFYPLLGGRTISLRTVELLRGVLFYFIVQGMTNVCGNNFLREESGWTKRNVKKRESGKELLPDWARNYRSVYVYNSHQISMSVEHQT